MANESKRDLPHGLASPGMIAFALIGALAMLRLPQLPTWPLAVFACVVGALCCRGRGFWRVAGMLVVGAGWLALRGSLALDARLPAEASGSDVEVVGRVVGLPRVEAERTVFDFALDRGIAPVEGRVRLAWYRPEMPIEAGARLRAKVRLRVPRGTRNPGGFDYESHALQRGLHAQGYLLGPPQMLGPDPRGALDRVRAGFAGRIASEVSDERAANLLRTLVVGDQGAMSGPDWETLRRTGTTHLVAISGFHVGIVAGIAALAAGGLARLWPRLGLRVPRRVIQSGAAIVAATGYGLIAGISLPVLRTLLMIAIVALAVASRRNIGVLQSLALAVATVLLFDPLGLLAAGFWLSFAGVAWLIFCLQGRTRERPLWLEFTRAQGVMALALLPLSIWFFQQASLTGAWINLLAIPWISLVTVPLGLLALALHGLGIEGVTWRIVLDLAAGSAALFWRLLDATSTWAGGQWYLPRPSLPALLLALAGTLLLLLPRGVGGRVAGLLLLLPLAAPRDQSPANGSLSLTMIDVGQGQAVLMRTHRHALLIDTGPRFASGLDMGEAAVVPTLRALGVGSLDALVVSHGDLDHDGGTESVLRVHAPARRLHGAPPSSWTRCRAGQRWRWDGVDFEVLHPPRWFPLAGNEASCVVLARTLRGRVLVPGDIGEVVERRLLREYPELSKLDVAVVAHHGSRGSSSPEWVEALAPRLALVSAGAENRFGHPHPHVVARWQEHAGQTLGTAGCGAIQALIGPQGLVAPAQCLRRDQPRWWSSGEP